MTTKQALSSLLFAVQQAVQNGCAPFEIEEAFEDYESSLASESSQLKAISKHTPAPWYVSEYGNICGDKPDGDHVITQIRGWNYIKDQPDASEIQTANARLIASAPDLLEACEIFAEWLRREDAGFDHKTHDRNTPEGEAVWREWFYGNLGLCGQAQEKAKAALRKAKGETE